MHYTHIGASSVTYLVLSLRNGQIRLDSWPRGSLKEEKEKGRNTIVMFGKKCVQGAT